MKVLIADDSAVVRQRLSEMLSDIEGVCIVGEAGDAVEAVGMFTKFAPDAIILDIRMPNGSGIDVLRHVKGISPATRVLILTNYPLSQYRDKCIEEGADYFFDKSNEFNRIVGVIKGLFPASV